ncbi:MAG: malonate-semialdehyde dehydrogenase (acetylating) / methylmalonate-semialdehyde dehydrogenase [Thermoleophilaceae bacterium]|jgi:malonate-semialdehyde dehydrogenase (acetylating)/methylmalonate-semialdehyde dehydrogenase|nr:malonate-semialdehyde dehydrogenase (acetylating) / methylmalonate-semialdehyde dehydrogenase [Thermoleophilaceae bacterium]
MSTTLPDRASRPEYEVTESATGEVVGRFPLATREEVDAVVASAREASEDWGTASVAARTQVLLRFRELVFKHRDDLARAVTREHGKVLTDAAGEVARGLEAADFACGLGHLLKGEATSRVSTAVDAHSVKQPLGVVAGITPFNFPVMVPMWMFPIALACGNAFILKPSEQDPSPSLLLASLLTEAGLPAGVFHVVHGDKVAVDALLHHPDVRAVSFVGSTPVARYVYETGTSLGKRVQALGGAKNHAVVMPDADLDSTADGLVSAAYGSAGQRCMAISVAVAVGASADPLVERLADRVRKLKVGPGHADGVDMGPLVSATHRDRVVGYVDAGVSEGATLVVDGRDTHVDRCEGGFFVGPCLFDHVQPHMTIYQDEIFGPVLGVVRVNTYSEAVKLVNENRWGNGAAIFTNDGGAAHRFELDVEAGMVGINVPIPVPVAYHSFGGWKESLFGDLNVHGPDGFRFYTKLKTVSTRWPDPTHRGIDLGFPTTS